MNEESDLEEGSCPLLPSPVAVTWPLCGDSQGDSPSRRAVWDSSSGQEPRPAQWRWGEKHQARGRNFSGSHCLANSCASLGRYQRAFWKLSLLHCEMGMELCLPLASPVRGGHPAFPAEPLEASGWAAPG